MGHRATRTRGVAAAAFVALAVAGGCSGSDDPGENRITRIDGPATVDGDGGAELDGAPAPADGVTEGVAGGDITHPL